MDRFAAVVCLLTWLTASHGRRMTSFTEESHSRTWNVGETPSLHSPADREVSHWQARLKGPPLKSFANLVLAFHSAAAFGNFNAGRTCFVRARQVDSRQNPAMVDKSAVRSETREENGLDLKYPWRFEGRLWFRPALVRTPAEVPGGARPIGLFGWTIGGVVCLEYDESPVGPYVEYVTMGSLVTKRGTIGQWGSRLFVSTDVAEEVCQRVWDVPAEVARMDYEEAPGEGLHVEMPPTASSATGKATIRVRGWGKTRSSEADSDPIGGLPVLWTPSIKALWFPLVPLSLADGETGLPLHRLRLSASSLRLRLCGQSPSEELGVPLPIGLTVDGLRIEIAREDGQL